MAGYQSCCFISFLWTLTLFRSTKTQKRPRSTWISLLFDPFFFNKMKTLSITSISTSHKAWRATSCISWPDEAFSRRSPFVFFFFPFFPFPNVPGHLADVSLVISLTSLAYNFTNISFQFSFLRNSDS